MQQTDFKNDSWPITQELFVLFTDSNKSLTQFTVTTSLRNSEHTCYSEAVVHGTGQQCLVQGHCEQEPGIDLLSHLIILLIPILLKFLQTT